jgi:Tfp pilus assembly protein PilF
VSLLLEALKKAELAKQQGQAGGQPAEAAPPAASEPGSGLSLEPQVSAGGDRPLMTRDRLPDITQPLEIFTEDLAPRGGASATGSPELEPKSAAPRRPAPPAERPMPGTPPAQDEDRASARQLFEAKSGDYEPRRPFLYAVGALGVVTLAVAGYFAYQVVAPRPSFYTGPAGGKQTPPAAAVASAPPPAAPAPAAPAAVAPPPQAAPAPSTPVPAPAAVAPAAEPKAVPAPPQPAPSGAIAGPAPSRAGGGTLTGRPRTPAAASGAAASEAAPRPAAAPRAPVKVTASGPRVDPGVERGWEALQAGDLARAKDEYTRALRANPLDRDALLGLAAIDVRNQDFESAEARYLKVLEIDPRDPYANAALVSMRGSGDAVQSESRLKTLIARQPDSAVLNFTLGNQYASQRRWPEAQQAFFGALAADPENPDYAYNLAVSLDQMRQPKLALEYYQRALALAGNRPVGFNTGQVQARVRELQR